jgi:hypothetical protein
MCRAIPGRSVFTAVVAAALPAAAILVTALPAVAILLAGAFHCASAQVPPPTTFLSVLGWEDDVDPVVAPDGEFMILCEETEDGSDARIRVVDLDALTGNVLGSYAIDAFGFENGVDPIILPELAGTGHPVFVPMESEDGRTAGVYALLLDAHGAVIQGDIIETGTLGFRPDVDGLWTHYALPTIAFFPMESEDHALTGVLAIDADPRPLIGAGLFGGCTLVSNAPVPGACVNNSIVPWLPGLVDAVDPVAYEKIGCCARIALPVARRDGSNPDVVIMSFDPNFEPPAFAPPPISVRAVNSAGMRPTNFPGFETDVDIRLFSGQCGFVSPTMLVPVEGPGDVADIYLLNQDGESIWTYSHDAGGPSVIRGFEKGVDLIPMCNLGVEPARVAVPVENAAGNDADLFILRLGDGHFIARAEDPALNPGLTVAGYEVGVDPVLWTSNTLVLPVEGPATPPGLIVLDSNALMIDRSFGGYILGFRRSVDLLVDSRTVPQLLIIPVGKDDGVDSNLLIGNNPPHLGGVTVETVNAGEVMADYQIDVDAGLVHKDDPGGAFLYLPEEAETGGAARLRITEVPTNAILAIATRTAHGSPGSLTFIGTNPLGTILSKSTDVLGLETGLDMACGRGQISQDFEPLAGPVAGQDGDGDPTLAWLEDPTSDAGGSGGAGPRRAPVIHENPASPPVAIRYSIARRGGDPGAAVIEIIDCGGRRVRSIAAVAEEGDQVAYWDGRDEDGHPAPSGPYFVRMRSGGGIATTSKLLLLAP